MSDQPTDPNEEAGEDTNTPVRFRAGDLLSQLQPRVNRRNRSIHLVAARDLRRYYRLLKEVLSTITLSREEALLVIAFLRDIDQDKAFETAQELPALAEKHGENIVETLSAKLRALNLLQRMALLDAVEQYHAHLTSATPPLPENELLVRVGLLRLT